ncbi:helix-turn-helix transcriptional regulator [Sedimentitalea todarodis]|uniref:Helix-turn-helix transcriptional regulator n=1 Tax=Sedimentitalea todarodis TaxID=1631240 RepID=A0ABU3VL89_9RHOB|nr:helix-turn-helix transcriptional regulator [Sedimentitalea todarodis]MDU9006948.1 helix-turn-helix transcriptional regulator [Sedimentitalea todarodis]
MASKLSAAIKAGLVLQGISQNHLAGLLDVSSNTVSAWAKDKHLPDKESLPQLVKVFKWSDDKLALLIEDWFENDHGERNYRVSGDEFITARYDGDYERFLADLIALDESTISGISREHEGTPRQWEPIFRQSPYTWRLLTAENEIAGYWQFICLKDAYFQRVLDGSLVDSEISIDMLDFPVVEGAYRGYFIAIATRLQDRSPNSLAILKSSIEKAIVDFARNGVLFSQFCATAFSFEGKRMCELMGMTYQMRHPRASDSEIADIFLIEGRHVAQSYWGRNSIIRQAYQAHFS